MKIRSLAFALLTFSFVPQPAWTFAEESQCGKITVHVDQPTVDLPDTLYGLFYEDINYAADGGLYAELVQNRSFEYYRVDGWNEKRGKLHPLYAWEKIQKEGGEVSITVENSQPLNSNNTKYVRLSIKQPGKGVGIANSGYAGIHVVEGDSYDFSMYVRRSRDTDQPVNVSLIDSTGTLAATSIAGISNDWTKVEATLKADRASDNARLEIVTTGNGDVLMDMISLFPQKTFNGRKNGLRADLVQALVDLKPAVFRFPGGCIAHGQGLDNAYRWKDTVGDVAERKPNWNLWGYHQSYGLGYFEYFQLCEDLGAEPLPILPVGVSCGFREPFENADMVNLQDWVEDAVDLVEFANGDASTKWGKIRVEMGHPEPFNLKYIGLGNEEHDTAEFRKRFPHFVRALRDEAPEIEIVGTSGLGPGIPIYDFMCEQMVEVSDEHYYNSPEWYLDNTHRFDDFERRDTKIFVGEYASQANRLFNAISEAAYLTGIERNADLVTMTAYAPLFARYGDTQWTSANLIWFDDTSVVLTPNYHVQRMFSVNKGDRYLKNESTFRLPITQEDQPAFGKLGIGTWSTSALFDDVKVTSGSEVVVDEEFSASDTDQNFEVVQGKFAVENGSYLQSDRAAQPAISLLSKGLDSDNFVFSLKAKKVSGNEGFLVVFGHKPSGNYYWWNVGGWGNTKHGLEKGSGGYTSNKSLVASKQGKIENNVWYDLRVEVKDGRIKCFLNDKLVHDVQLNESRISVAASREEASGDVIVKIVNPTTKACTTKIDLQGVKKIGSSATLTLLTGNKDDANDLEHPDRVKPVVTEIEAGNSFDYTIPPMSVQFIRVNGSKQSP